MFLIHRIAIAVVFFILLAVLLTNLPAALNPIAQSKEKIEADQQWVNTSPHWLDRQACRWMSLCGLTHLRRDPPFRDPSNSDETCVNITMRRHFTSHIVRRGDVVEMSNKTASLRSIPDYVIHYAPLVHLYSEEYFWPTDIDEHIKHIMPFIDDLPLNRSEPPSLSRLNLLDTPMGLLTLKSKDNVECRPSWLHSSANIPVSLEDEDHEADIDYETSGRKRVEEDATWLGTDKDRPLPRSSESRRVLGNESPVQLSSKRRGLSRMQRRIALRSMQNKPNEKGYSRAPATLILVDKGSDVVDAFWFFFYAYNLGQTVLGTRYGNHVGDWEHTMIRFESGIPRAVYFSEHEGGQAYAWEAVEKRWNVSQTERPVIYSAVGSHAMYAMPGDHPYVLPFKLLRDQTDHGPLWDPSQNFRSYWYDFSAAEEVEELEPTQENPDAPTGWFHFKGRWGDKVYGLDDKRQWRLFGQYHYVTGPQGPKFKNLERERVCQASKCRQLHSIAEGRKGSWYI
ncbi:hypothetical protein GGS21DRAFT_541340 [Xylaria nigripes]|nr:hypothetical protein GGS21DRAFT_541340 [Xylaria nigripes]